MSGEALAIQTEAWAQQEIQAQRELLEILRRQEAAIRRGSTSELVATTTELDAALAGTPVRDARRRGLARRIVELAGREGSEPRADSLTLGALATRLERQGIDAARLRAAREELRATVAEVVRAARRLASIARYHGGVLEELCAVLGQRDASRGGALVDAEA